MEIGSVDNSSGGNDIASQITRLTKQITKVTQQLKEVAMVMPQQKKAKAARITRIQLATLQAQLRNCSVSRPKRRCQSRKKVRQSRRHQKPSAEHQINIYV
ncbi:FlxA-like family protein [Enterobacter hormaechei]